MHRYPTHSSKKKVNVVPRTPPKTVANAGLNDSEAGPSLVEQTLAAAETDDKDDPAAASVAAGTPEAAGPSSSGSPPGSGDAAAVKAAVSDSKVDGAWLRSGGQRDARPGAIRARRGIQREHKMGDLDKAAKGGTGREVNDQLRAAAAAKSYSIPGLRGGT